MQVPQCIDIHRHKESQHFVTEYTGKETARKRLSENELFLNKDLYCYSTETKNQISQWGAVGLCNFLQTGDAYSLSLSLSLSLSTQLT